MRRRPMTIRTVPSHARTRGRRRGTRARRAAAARASSSVVATSRASAYSFQSMAFTSGERLVMRPHRGARMRISKINCRDAEDQISLTVMDLGLAPLRALAAVARHGSFSRAAAELSLTQPAVSMQVRQLEDRVGSPLLERVGKRATPTRAGEILLAHAARAFLELEAGVEQVRRLRGIVAGRLRLGTSASVSIYLLPPLLRRFRKIGRAHV